jgi:hypothetical protein
MWMWRSAFFNRVKLTVLSRPPGFRPAHPLRLARLSRHHGRKSEGCSLV